MQYALVNNFKTEPAKGLKGICTCCGKEVIAKCGKIKVHHWAHKSSKECDSWWEPETQWHRDWKKCFSFEFREVPFTDTISGEIHRADVHTANGITIEFQNSPISTEELKSREQFYTKLIWVINGLKFKGNFEFISIPDPNDPLLNEFDFVGRAFFKKEDIMNSEDMIQVYGTGSRELAKLTISNIHFAFDWKNQHKVWFDSDVPVFLDFGHDFLYWLKKREQIRSPFWYVMVVKKSEFIIRYSV